MSSTESTVSRRPARRPVGRGVLLRYRVIAFVTAVLLLVLVFIGVPLQIFAGQPAVAQWVGFVHGMLYMVYVLLALEVSIKLRVPLLTMLGIILAGTVPFCAFFAERHVTHVWNQKIAAARAAAANPTAAPADSVSPAS